VDDERPDATRVEQDFAAMWSSDGVTRSLAPTATGVPADLPFLFSAGQHFGPYRIVRPIGKGGMGQVYEAEEVESGRRVAVKILSRGIGDEEERERFQQEGRLAASLSHPNIVCVFGTTEVQGFPVIAMELAPSGTLKDLVVPGAPVPPARAIDVVLQVIDGLEAAAAGGILHRDIKPSNCFVAADGRVLVGDFGLSITTLARAGAAGETLGTILGTPGFASPEQLKGAALDVRSDIYSVGATIYYLLAGKPPFDDPNLQTMMTRVASEVPPPLALARPDIPPRLASVVAKCLARNPSDRYAGYTALRSALEPFRSAALKPAPLLRRFIAGAIDGYVASLPVIPINMYLGATVLDLTSTRTIVWSTLPAFFVTLTYFAFFEGRFGCGAGKALFNLRVVDERESPPGIARALVRALVFVLPGQCVRLGSAFLVLPLVRIGPTDPVTQTLIAVAAVGISVLVFGLQFSTIRRRNGWAAVQDLASATRVVLRPRAMAVRASAVRATRDPTAAFDGGVPAGAAEPRGWDRVGPYLVPRGSFAVAHARRAPLVVEGFDDRLRRYVWVELLPEQTPPVPAWRRDLSRAGRLRWLSGRRLGGDSWDAYETVDGVPFSDAIAAPQPWTRVRHWIADLGVELAAASSDPAPPVLSPDRVWIGADDRARLLDVPPPEPRTADRESTNHEPVNREPAPFLYSLAVGALHGNDPAAVTDDPPGVPLPVTARTFLLSLRDTPRPSASALAAASDLLRTPADFPRGRRAAQIAVCACIPVIMPLAVLGGLRVQQNVQSSNPGAFAYTTCLSQLVAFEKKGDANLTAAQRHNRDLVEIYIAEHLQDEVKEGAAVARSFPVVTTAKGGQPLAERAVARHPRRTPEEVKQADALVARAVSSSAQGLAQLQTFVAKWGLVTFITIWSSVVIACTSLVGALATGSGFVLRTTGAALVNRRGETVSRWRALWRALVAWSPLVPGLLLLRVAPKIQDTTVAVALAHTLPLLLLAAGAVYAIRHPSRALQDRAAGTWIVPR
jgi:hypothetical protein